MLLHIWRRRLKSFNPGGAEWVGRVERGGSLAFLPFLTHLPAFISCLHFFLLPFFSPFALSSLLPSFLSFSQSLSLLLSLSPTVVLAASFLPNGSMSAGPPCLHLLGRVSCLGQGWGQGCHRLGRARLGPGLWVWVKSRGSGATGWWPWVEEVSQDHFPLLFQPFSLGVTSLLKGDWEGGFSQRSFSLLTPSWPLRLI